MIFCDGQGLFDQLGWKPLRALLLCCLSRYPEMLGSILYGLLTTAKGLYPGPLHLHRVYSDMIDFLFFSTSFLMWLLPPLPPFMITTACSTQTNLGT